MRTSSKGHRKHRWIAAAAVIIAGLVVYSRLTDGENPIIRTAKVERGDVTAVVSANGVLQPLTTVEVKSNVGGQIVKMEVDEGDQVKAGQVIARIDPTDTLMAFEQSQADLAASLSKVDQARKQLEMQKTQSEAAVVSAKHALAAARARLNQAEEQARVQPLLTVASVSQAKSALSAAEAALRQLQDALIPQRLAAAQAAYDQAKASHDTAQKDLNRLVELLKKGYVPKSQVDAAEEKFSVAKAQLASARTKLETVKDETNQDLRTAQARLEQAQAEYENAKANRIQDKIKQEELASAKAAVKQAEAALQAAIANTLQEKIRRADIIQANAQVERSEAALKNARTQLSYTTIVAPRDGIVTKKYVEAGSIVTAGRSSFAGAGSGVAIVDIADTSRMFALVSVDETDIAQVEIGQEVDVTVEAYPDELFSGKVTKIAPQSVTEQNVTTIPVTVEIDIPDPRLKPGMNVSCDFITGRAKNVLRVPNEAVNDTDGGSTVTVLDRGKQVTRKVEIGLVGTDYTEIKRGLKEGQEVVTAVVEPAVAGRSQFGTMGRTGGMGRMGGPGMFGPR